MAFSKTQKVLSVVIAAIIFALAIVYFAGAFYFSNHFFPNTVIGQNNISMKSTADFASDIRQKTQNYVLDVRGEGFWLVITKDDAGISINEDNVAIETCTNQNEWAWPIEVFMDHNAADAITTLYDQEAVQTLVQNAVAAYNETVPASVNATIVYDPDSKTCIIQEEVYGSQINGTVLLEQVDECITSLEENCVVTEDDLLKPTILSTDERFPAALEKANAIVGGEIALTLNGSVQAGVVDKALISDWLILDDESLMPGVDSEKVQAWADALATDLNTVGKTRTYTRADGKTITVSGGSYGWSVDTANLATNVTDQLNAANFAAIDIPVSQAANAYNGIGKRDWGSYVDVDISEQTARYYDASDNLIYTAAFVSGLPANGRATPEGAYFVNAKQSPSVLIGYTSTGEKDYETPVTFWMPFIRNSIGFHDATWQSSFGGSRYLTNGSHGCVNLSYSDAQWFYNNIPTGTAVIVHS